MLRIFKYTTDKQKYADKEVGESGFIPYLCHYNSNSILTKNNASYQSGWIFF